MLVSAMPVPSSFNSFCCNGNAVNVDFGSRKVLNLESDN